MNYSNNVLYELVDIESIEMDESDSNTIDIQIDDDSSFLLSNGFISHNSSVSAFRKFRNPEYQGAFPLRGKFINVSEIPDTKVLQNKEVQSIMSSLGLKVGHKPKDLRYGKILLYTDQDQDGFGIAGLLVNFFGKYWPELFDEGRILKVDTPIVVAKKGKQILSFYTETEYKTWLDKNTSTKSWNIEYKKGLASLEDDEYREIIINPRSYEFTPDKEFKHTLNVWFSGNSEPRKEKILGFKPNVKNTKSLFK